MPRKKKPAPIDHVTFLKVYAVEMWSPRSSGWTLVFMPASSSLPQAYAMFDRRPIALYVAKQFKKDYPDWKVRVRSHKLVPPKEITFPAHQGHIFGLPGKPKIGG